MWARTSSRAVLGALSGFVWVAACTADLRDIEADDCLFVLNGVCDEPDLCAEGTDLADCHPGLYGGCHTKISTFDNRRCEAFEFCAVTVTQLPIVESVCAPACQSAEDCPSAPDDREVRCDEFTVPFFGNATIEQIGGCVMVCAKNSECPDGMRCNKRKQCMWFTPD